MSIWMGEKGERVREREGEFEIKTVLSLKLKKTTINPPSSCPSLVCADFCLNILVYTKRQKHIYANSAHETTITSNSNHEINLSLSCFNLPLHPHNKDIPFKTYFLMLYSQQFASR